MVAEPSSRNAPVKYEDIFISLVFVYIKKDGTFGAFVAWWKILIQDLSFFSIPFVIL